jgi:hypothetical protein
MTAVSSEYLSATSITTILNPCLRLLLQQSSRHSRNLARAAQWFITVLTSAEAASAASSSRWSLRSSLFTRLGDDHATHNLAVIKYRLVLASANHTLHSSFHSKFRQSLLSPAPATPSLLLTHLPSFAPHSRTQICALAYRVTHSWEVRFQSRAVLLITGLSFSVLSNILRLHRTINNLASIREMIVCRASLTFVSDSA